jgi:hypothetical protein
MVQALQHGAAKPAGCAYATIFTAIAHVWVILINWLNVKPTTCNTQSLQKLVSSAHVLCDLTSQPVEESPSQLRKPKMHAPSWHCPSEHPTTALAKLQLLPHVPHEEGECKSVWGTVRATRTVFGIKSTSGTSITSIMCLA